MARHETYPLDRETAALADKRRATLRQASQDGATVAMTVQARDTGAVSDRRGTVAGFNGSPGMSTDTVILDTDKGPRSFNVWLIRSLEIVE